MGRIEKIQKQYDLNDDGQVNLLDYKLYRQQIEAKHQTADCFDTWSDRAKHNLKKVGSSYYVNPLIPSDGNIRCDRGVEATPVLTPNQRKFFGMMQSQVPGRDLEHLFDVYGSGKTVNVDDFNQYAWKLLDSGKITIGDLPVWQQTFFELAKIYINEHQLPIDQSINKPDLAAISPAEIDEYAGFVIKYTNGAVVNKIIPSLPLEALAISSPDASSKLPSNHILNNDGLAILNKLHKLHKLRQAPK